MKIFKIVSALVVAVMLMGASVDAQVVSSSNITLEAAKKVVAEAVKYAKEHNSPGGSIAVVDNGGNLVYRKDWTAHLLHHRRCQLKKQTLPHYLRRLPRSLKIQSMADARR